jgi:aminoglycoside phosphotransferase (APT) family kinase protein
MAVAAEGALPRAVPKALTGGGTLARTAPALGQAIARVAAGLRTGTIVHGNLDFEHVFVAPEPDRRIQLVGWDGAGAGDPAWDVGAVIESYYAWALDPAIVSGIEGPVFTLDGAGLRGLLDSFWAAYASAAGLAGEVGRGLLLRAVGFAGARLVARIDAMLNAPDRAAAATAGVQAAAAMLTNPAVVADLIVPRAPALPQRWAAVR